MGFRGHAIGVDNESVKYLVVASFVAVVALVYVLSNASANTDFFSHDFPRLLGATAVLVSTMFALVLYQIWQLRRKMKAGLFGTKLTVRLLLVFGLMALLPGTVVYAVSVQFMSRSIESWFNVRVDHALDSGLNLGQSALDSLQHELGSTAELMAQQLAETPSGEQGRELNSLREQYAVQEAVLYNEHGRLLSFAGSQIAGGLPPAPDNQTLMLVRQQHMYSHIESMGDRGLILRVVVPVNVLSLTETMRVLQVLQPVPDSVASDADAVRAAYQDYQQLSLSRVGLKRLYGMTLTLTMVLTLLTTVVLAFLISEQIAAPLRALAKGTRAVAKGDFSQMHPVSSRDELGMLTQSFNRMTRQLSDARNVAEDRRAQIEKSYAYLEAVLASLTSGVITFDDQLRVRGVNPAAELILCTPALSLRGSHPFQWLVSAPHLSELVEVLVNQFKLNVDGVWQQQMMFQHQEQLRILLVRGTQLPSGMDSGYVLVFDDITDLLRAQRDAAWGEVARRLAHEIKNPLTPIQLSAERIEHKLFAKLNAEDGESLRRATKTIVNQVSAMKEMVNAFADYARTPATHLTPVNLNALVKDVLDLYGYDSAIQLALTDPLPAVMGDAKLLRQVVHNLLQNAQDALAGVLDPKICIATTVQGDQIELAISDNGSGLSSQVRERLFEPYATTKPKGTGLGLAIVKKIVEEHQGVIVLENQVGGGVVARVRLAVLANCEQVT